jgi:hypothetical protein
MAGTSPATDYSEEFNGMESCVSKIESTFDALDSTVKTIKSA